MGAPGSDGLTLSVEHDGTWRAVCPPRQRGRTAIQAIIGFVAGLILVAVAATGIVESMNQPSWGAQIFLLGWLGPLGLIGALMVWFAWNSAQRLWQVDILESDGSTVVHRRVNRSGHGSVLFEMSLDRIEPFELPGTAEGEPMDDSLGDDATAPLGVRYRVPNEETIYSYTCFLSITRAEMIHLSDAVNPLIDQSTNQS